MTDFEKMLIEGMSSTCDACGACDKKNLESVNVERWFEYLENSPGLLDGLDNAVQGVIEQAFGNNRQTYVVFCAKECAPRERRDWGVLQERLRRA